MSFISKACVLLSLFSASAFAAPIPTHLAELFDKVDACGHNGSGSISKFEVSAFSATEAMADLRKADRGYCKESREYSSSREEAVQMFRDFLATDDEARKCLEEALSKEEMRQLYALVGRPSNLAVMASLYSPASTEDAEACSYYNFAVYTEDGVQLFITFNYTD